MSDVTGVIGTESVRLRGMALEDTQFQILRTLEKMAGAESSAGRRVATLGEASREAAEQTAGAGGKMAKLAGVVAAVGKKLSIITDVAETFSRTIRGFDTNIKDTGYGFGQLSNAARTSKSVILKMFGELSEFSETSVRQLEDQYAVYRRLTDIGGIVSSEFDNMRVRANMLGVGMEEYASIAERFAESLRLGGGSVRTSMNRLVEVTDRTRRGSREVMTEFNRLGIGASNYAEHVLKTTSLLGGFNKVFNESGGNQDVFNRKILDLTRTTTGLSAAFGYSRDKIMSAAEEAMKDATMAQLFEDLQVEGKEEVRQLLTSMFGKEGTRVAYGLLTGQMDEIGGLFASLGGGLTQSLMQFTQIYGKTKDLDTALRQSGLGQALMNSKDQIKALGVATLDATGAEKAVVNGLMNLIRTAGSETQIREKMTAAMNRTNTESDRQLDSLGLLQRENIELAISFAATNQILNKFGLTTAHAMQVILKAMAETGKIGMQGLDDLQKNIDLLSNVEDRASIVKELTSAISKSASEVVREATRRSDVNQPSGNRTGGEVVNENRGIQVQGRSTTVRDIDAVGMEATRGGPTPSFIRQFIAQLAEYEKLNIQGIRDTHRRDTRSHIEGRAIDFTIPDGKAGAERAMNQVRKIMETAGLKENQHYKVVNEYILNTPNKTGDHLHVEFTPEGADLFEKYRQRLVGGSQTSAIVPEPRVATLDRGQSTATVTTSTQNQTDGERFTVNNMLDRPSNTVNTVTKEEFNMFAQNFIDSFGRKADDIKNDLSRQIANVDTSLRQILAG